MGKERKRLSRHTRVIKNGSSSFLIQSFQLSIMKAPAQFWFVLFCSFLCCYRIFQANSEESCSLLHHRVRKIWPLKLSNC